MYQSIWTSPRMLYLMKLV